MIDWPLFGFKLIIKENSRKSPNIAPSYGTSYIWYHVLRNAAHFQILQPISKKLPPKSLIFNLAVPLRTSGNVFQITERPQRPKTQVLGKLFIPKNVTKSLILRYSLFYLKKCTKFQINLITQKFLYILRF